MKNIPAQMAKALPTTWFSMFMTYLGATLGAGTQLGQRTHNQCHHFLPPPAPPLQEIPCYALSQNLVDGPNNPAKIPILMKLPLLMFAALALLPAPPIWARPLKQKLSVPLPAR